MTMTTFVGIHPVTRPCRPLPRGALCTTIPMSRRGPTRAHKRQWAIQAGEQDDARA